MSNSSFKQLTQLQTPDNIMRQFDLMSLQLLLKGVNRFCRRSFQQHSSNHFKLCLSSSVRARQSVMSTGPQ